MILELNTGRLRPENICFQHKNKKIRIGDITHVSKHVSPEKLIEMKTKSGRKIVVTKDHLFPDRAGEKVRRRMQMNY